MGESELVAELSGCTTAVEFAAAWWAGRLRTLVPPEDRPHGGAGVSVTGTGALAAEHVAAFAGQVSLRLVSALECDSAVRLVAQPGRAGLISRALTAADPSYGDLGDSRIAAVLGDWDMRITPTTVSLRTIHTLEPRLPLWPDAAPDLDEHLAGMGAEVTPQAPLGGPLLPRRTPSSLLRGERPFEDTLMVIASIMPRQILRIDALGRRIVLAYIDRDALTLDALVARIAEAATSGIDSDDPPLRLPAWDIAWYAVDDEYTALTENPIPGRLAPPTMEKAADAAILLAENTPASYREDVLRYLCDMPTGIEVLDGPDAPQLSRPADVLVSAAQLAAVSVLTAHTPADARIALIASIAAIEDTALSSTDRHPKEPPVSDDDACALLHDLGGPTAALTASGETSFQAAELIAAAKHHLNAVSGRQELEAEVEMILRSYTDTTPTRPDASHPGPS